VAELVPAKPAVVPQGNTDAQTQPHVVDSLNTMICVTLETTSRPPNREADRRRAAGSTTGG
jgi:hypothetical protein